jgi:hypothetical protein
MTIPARAQPAMDAGWLERSRYTIWQMATLADLDRSASIRSLEIDLPLSEIYARVTFD